MKYTLPLIGCALLSACAQVTPPNTPLTLPDRYATPVAGSLPTGDAWASLGDPGLTQWIEQVWARNTDLAAGVARLDEAQAELTVITADRYPKLDFEHSAERRRQSKYDLGEVSEETKNPSTRHASQLVFGYELDLRGRIRAAIRAGEADRAARQFDHTALRLSLARETATLWFNRAELQHNLTLANQQLTLQRQILDSTQRKRRAGLLSGNQLHTLEQELNEVDWQLRQENDALQRVERSLCQLAAMTPTDCRLPEGKPLDQLRQPAVGNAVPAELLQRRPDLAAAQARYDAARARIDEAEAARWPALTLAGVLGVSAGNWAGLRRHNARNWSLMPQLAMPLFDAGRLLAEADKARSTAAESYASWHGAILQAVHEVEDAAATLQYAAQQDDNRQQQQAIADRQYRATEQARRVGLGTAQAEWQAGLQRLQSAKARSAAQRERLQSTVALISALGGGWRADSPSGTVQAAR
ncbi:efflux transporter outer membrane subunit [Chitinivorax sp. B]|uniref:efflux transporter outer membrane subunit n=1 Tax=Chitinivorax sp. B TaxID=2502235 RepID=UPI0010F78197|nr:efflux transporter outer membrane subunit [Chitinivorax sp. B]